MEQTFELSLFKSTNYGDLCHLEELVKLVDGFLKRIGLDFKYAAQVAKANLLIVPKNKFVMRKIYALTLAGIWNVVIDDYLEADPLNCTDWMDLMDRKHEAVLPVELLYKEFADIMAEATDDYLWNRFLYSIRSGVEANLREHSEREQMQDISLAEYYKFRNGTVFAEYLLFSLEYGVDYFFNQEVYNSTVMLDLRANYGKYICIINDMHSVSKDTSKGSIGLNCIAIKSRETGLDFDQTFSSLIKDLEIIEEKMFLVLADVSTTQAIDVSYLDCFSNFLSICLDAHRSLGRYNTQKLVRPNTLIGD